MEVRRAPSGATTDIKLRLDRSIKFLNFNFTADLNILEHIICFFDLYRKSLCSVTSTTITMASLFKLTSVVSLFLASMGTARRLPAGSWYYLILRKQ